MANEKEKPWLIRALLGFLTWIGIIAALIVILAFVADIQNKYEDANTHIVDAEVVSKDKTSGTRRSLPRYYLVIQEKDKSETTKVFVNIGTWSWCEKGDLYTDVPGDNGSCAKDFVKIKTPLLDL